MLGLFDRFKKALEHGEPGLNRVQAPSQEYPRPVDAITALLNAEIASYQFAEFDASHGPDVRIIKVDQHMHGSG